MITFDIVTRHMPHRRPRSLARLQATIRAQTYGGWEHVVLRDDVGIGLPAADGMFASYSPRGDYVLLVDDDDLLHHDTALEELAQFIITQDRPPVVICRMVSVTHGELPYPEDWQGTPQCGRISGQNIISRADIWAAHCKAWAHGSPGDWSYIKRVFKSEKRIEWMDAVLIDQQYRGWGTVGDEGYAVF